MRIALVLFFLIFYPCAVHAQEIIEDSGLLRLVNREKPLAADFRPTDLVDYNGAELRAPARDAFVEMLAAMEAEGILGLKLQSAYRSYSYQRAVFEKRIGELTSKGKSRSEAEAVAARSVQIPGASEHQLGLALDVSINGELSQSFADTDAGKWIAENCHKFGFVVRYPQDKTDVTGIIYEPWHLRFVGIPHSQIMNEDALTLEEYHDYLRQIHMYVVWEDGFYYLVMYSETAPEADSRIISVSATEYGENAGYIVTFMKQI